MRSIKLIFYKIGNGFLTGLGFAIVLAIFYWGAFVFFESQDEYSSLNDSSGIDCTNFKKCTNNAGLDVNIISERASDTEFVLLGEISNSSN